MQETAYVIIECDRGPIRVKYEVLPTGELRIACGGHHLITGARVVLLATRYIEQIRDAICLKSREMEA